MSWVDYDYKICHGLVLRLSVPDCGASCLSLHNDLPFLIYIRFSLEYGNRHFAMTDAEEIDELEVQLKAFQTLDEQRNVCFRVSNISNNDGIIG